MNPSFEGEAVLLSLHTEVASISPFLCTVKSGHLVHYKCNAFAVLHVMGSADLI